MPVETQSLLLQPVKDDGENERWDWINFKPQNATATANNPPPPPSAPELLDTLKHIYTTYSEPTEPSSSDWLVSSSDWSLRRSQGKMAEESAISKTGAMLGLRLPAPFSVGRVSFPHSSGGSACWRSIATVPENHKGGIFWEAKQHGLLCRNEMP